MVTRLIASFGVGYFAWSLVEPHSFMGAVLFIVVWVIFVAIINAILSAIFEIRYNSY
jgi:hypothetical protein